MSDDGLYGGERQCPLLRPGCADRDEIANVANRVAYGHEWFVLTRHGRAAVAIIPASDLELLEYIEDHIDVAEARKALAASKGQRVSLADLRAELGL